MFHEIATSDPQCAMADWDAAMSMYHQLWAPPSQASLEKGVQSVQKAREIRAKTRRERDYIDAIAVFFEDWRTVDHATRAARYEQAMGRIYARYPSDREARVSTPSRSTRLRSLPYRWTRRTPGRKRPPTPNQVLRQEPGHPGVTHYLIHSYDYPALAHLALAAARRYARIAPSSAHALHMPSHIFTRLGLWARGLRRT